MTREEAIKWLKNLKKDIGHPRHEALWHYEQALDETIEALEREKRFEKSFEGDALFSYYYGLQRGYDNGHRDAYQEFAELLKKLKEREEL